jgi:hypothetical protein
MMRVLRGPVLLGLAAGLAVMGWLLMGTNFMIHDDEGYVLMGLRQFSAQGRLYDEVFTQYGPTPFLYYDSLHRLLDWPITNLFGRSLTLLNWLAAAVASGLIAWRLSGRFWTALVTLAVVFGFLWMMTWEPPHPGGLVALITATSLAAAVEAVWRGRTGLAALVLGAAGAALILTKINVGLLWICSAGAFLLLHTGGPLARRGAWLAAAGLAVLPFILMRPLLGEPWVLTLAVMFAVSGVTVCATLSAEATPTLRLRDWLAAAAGLAGFAAVIIAAVLLRGTSVHGLLQGVLLAPLRHPVNFQLGLPAHTFAWVALAAAVGIGTLWCPRPDRREMLRHIVAGLRLVVLGCFAWNAEPWLTIHGVRAMVCYALPLTPLFLLPLNPAPAGNPRRLATALVALVGLGQVLHTYPVAGTQMSWATFLLLPLFILGIAEAGAHFARRLDRPWLATAVAAFALVIAGWQLNLLARQGWARWNSSDPLGLPGAESVRPPENVRFALRILTANAGLHADMLFSRPGMFSFNLWSGLPTPTSRNATHWFWLLSAREQQAIITRLQAAPRSAVISSQPLIDFLAQEINLPVTGPLNDFISAHYRPLFRVSGYDFMVPHASAAAPFFVAQNYQRAADAPAIEPGLIIVNVAANATVARIVLRSVHVPGHILGEWRDGHGRVLLERINAAGQAAGNPQPCPWPLKIDGLRQVRLYHDDAIPGNRAGLQLVFLDDQGRSLFEACYDESPTASAPPAGG